MKSFMRFLFSMVAGLCLAIALAATSAWAQVTPVPGTPDLAWLGTILTFVVSAFPTVGPILVDVLGWLALISTAMTVLSAAAISLFSSAAVAAKFVGAPQLAEKIKAISDKVLPYLQYLSMFNAPKKSAPPAVQ